MTCPLLVLVYGLSILPAVVSGSVVVREVTKDTQAESGLDFSLTARARTEQGCTTFELVIPPGQEPLRYLNETTLVVANGEELTFRVPVEMSSQKGPRVATFSIGDRLLEHAVVRLEVGRDARGSDREIWYEIRLKTYSPALGATGGAAASGRQVPIVVSGEAMPAEVEAGSPIPLKINIANGLAAAIAFHGYGVESTDWNGETINVRLVDVHRAGDRLNLYLKGPVVEPPLEVAGMSQTVIEPGKSLAVSTDARKWEIRGGWKPGRYRVTVRVDGLRIDDFTSANVLSEPFEFVINQERRPVGTKHSRSSAALAACLLPLPGSADATLAQTDRGIYAGPDGKYAGREHSKSVKETWKDVKVEFLRPGKKRPEVVKAKRAIYELKAENGSPQVVPVVTFVAPGSGAIWGGPEQDRYLETDTGIVGFHVVASKVVWCESLLSSDGRARAERKELSEVVADFEEEVTGSVLRNAVHPADRDEWESMLTYLKPSIKNPWMFTNGQLSAQGGTPKIVSAQLSGDLVELGLTDETEQFRATVWIDIRTRRVKRAEEGPWEFFPKNSGKPR